MRALILSAGLGERLRPLTSKRAKPAIEFLNMPMLAFPYHWLNTLGLSDVVFNTHHLPESIRHAAMHVVSPETRLHFSHEAEILGSGGGIWNARFDLMKDKTFAVANGDGVVLSPDQEIFRRMLEQHEWDQALATILVCPLDGVGTKFPGVWIDDKGAVLGFGKSSPGGGATCWHYASYMLFSDELWPLLPEGGSNILYDVLEPNIKKGARVRAFLARDLRWFETGNIPDYLNATRETLQLVRDGAPLGRCALEILSAQGRPFGLRSKFDQCTLIADSAEVDPAVRIQGFAVIGENARVGAGSSLKDSVILSEAAVDGLNVENSVVI
jgi:NDP-sugar pyrophosphorylase family protein